MGPVLEDRICHCPDGLYEVVRKSWNPYGV